MGDSHRRLLPKTLRLGERRRKPLGPKFTQTELPEVATRPTSLGGVRRGIAARKVSTWLGQFFGSFVEWTGSGLLIQAAVGSLCGTGGWRTNRSGWLA